MKRVENALTYFWISVAILFICYIVIGFPIVVRADSKTTALTADTAPVATDIIGFVKDPGGSPLDRNLTFGNLTKALTLANFPASANVVTMLGSANNAAILSNIGAQPSLGVLAGTLTNTYLCTYTSSGTLLACNTNPATFQAALTYPITGVASPSAGYLMKWGASGNTAVDGLKFGTMTDGKYCTYTTANGLVCNSTISVGGDLLANGTVPLTANWDVGAFTITAAGFTAAKTSGVAGLNSLYESATTSTKYIGWMGPTTLNPSESWSYQLKETPPSAGGIMVFAAPTGTGDPNGNKVSAQSWLQPGTGVATALAVNVGSAGAPVVFNGALGTPSSGTLTNATGLPIAGIASLGTGVGTALAANANGAGGFVVVGNAAGTSAVLTGYSSGAGTVAGTDTILGAINKLNGNTAAKAPLASPTFTGTTTLPDAPSCPVFASTSTATGNINIDGAAYCDYSWNNTSTAATYTPVITAPPASGKVRYVTFTVGGGSGVDTMTWTNVTWMGTAGAAATTTNKKSTYACIVPASGSARCSIVAEAY